MIKPKQIAALSVIPLKNTELGRLVQQGSFIIPGADGITRELRELIRAITIDRVQFMANHASNYLPISGRLLKDKETMLNIIDSALAGKISFVPEANRAL